MIDVNKITSTLAKLPDAQLQQYAQMHKNDPYIMALAMSESNRRKELRDAAPAQQGMQEQPKVVDQMVAEMAPQQMPEEMGIGRLPTGDMNFANGGIIAFAGGGDVEHYYGGGSIFDPVTGVPISSDTPSDSDLTMLERIGLFNPENRRALERGEKALAARKALPTLNKATMPAPGYTRTDPRAAPASAFTDSVKALSDTPPPAGPRVPPAAPAATKPVDAGPQGIEALQQKYFGPLDQEIGILRNQRAGLAADYTAMGKELEEATNKRIAERGDVYKGREERLAKREGELEGMGSKYAGLALLQAGAAMMSTPGGIGMALGKGVQVGSERYAAGIEKINAAKEKFAEARERLDDLRINRDDMNARDKETARREAKKLEMQGRELIHNGAVQDLGMKEKQVTAVFGVAAEALNTDKRIAAERENTMIRERGANARASRNSQLELLQAVQKDPSLAAAYQSLHGTKNDLMSQYNDYLSKNPTGSVEDFLKTKAVFSALSGLTNTKPVSNVPANASVLQLGK